MAVAGEALEVASLETKTAFVCGFYRPPVEDPDIMRRVALLRAWLETNAETFAYIVHDLDVNADGERCTSHVHFVFKAQTTKRLGTFLNEISDGLDVDTQAVTLDKASSVARCVRYLIHKDDPQKHQYPLGSVVHNWPDVEWQKVFAGKDRQEIDFDYLLGLVRRSAKITDVICVLGLGTYRYWRQVIVDMWKDLHKE